MPEPEDTIRRALSFLEASLSSLPGRDFCLQDVQRARGQLTEIVAERDVLLAERQQDAGNVPLASSELDWLIGYLSETDEHAAEHARRARAALAAPRDPSQDRETGAHTPADVGLHWDGRKVYDYETVSYLGRAVSEPYSDGIEGMIALRQDEDGQTIKPYALCAFVVLDNPPEIVQEAQE